MNMNEQIIRILTELRPEFDFTQENKMTVHNNESIVFVALSLDNFEPGDEKNRLKLDSLRKLFE